MREWRLACQENLLPGGDAVAMWRTARELGFEAIELRGQLGDSLGRRLPELRAAVVEGAVYSSVCVDMDVFPGSQDPARRERAIQEITAQLEAIAELGGAGVVTPAAFGEFSRALPPYGSGRSLEQDREVLFGSLEILARRAAALGVKVLLEPLNRYEVHMVNTLAEAREYADALGGEGIGVVADSFHLNIEEADVGAALADHADVLAHVQVSDSNRGVPGMGHLEWGSFLGALRGLGYAGTIAVECQLGSGSWRDLAGVRRTFEAALDAAD